MASRTTTDPIEILLEMGAVSYTHRRLPTTPSGERQVREGERKKGGKEEKEGEKVNQEKKKKKEQLKNKKKNNK